MNQKHNIVEEESKSQEEPDQDALKLDDIDIGSEGKNQNFS